MFRILAYPTRNDVTKLAINYAWFLTVVLQTALQYRSSTRTGVVNRVGEVSTIDWYVFHWVVVFMAGVDWEVRGVSLSYRRIILLLELDLIANLHKRRPVMVLTAAATRLSCDSLMYTRVGSRMRFQASLRLKKQRTLRFKLVVIWTSKSCWFQLK